MEAPTANQGPRSDPLDGVGVRDARRRHYEREHKLRARYGIGYAEVKALREAQGGLCAICRQRRAVAVDHDHESGHVRGLLCNGCNRALAILGDDLAGVLNAMEYLLPHSVVRAPE